MSNLSDSPKEYTNIRKPAVAGSFYPGDASRLEFAVNKYLNQVPEDIVSPSPYEGEGRGEVGEVKAIMVPHAGYDYSALTAAHSYSLLKDKKIDTAIIICNSHKAYFDGIAVDNNDAWETPLGLLEVDKDLAGKIVNSNSEINFNSQVHAGDHTLEIQLPFLQVILGNDFKIVPILFGNSSGSAYKELAKALKANMEDNDILIISTDMSHYPAYEDANEIDNKTLEMIKTADISKLEEHIKEVEKRGVAGEQTLLCGIDGVKTAMELYSLANWNFIEILKYQNSGDALIGDKSSVVGYGAAAFFGPPPSGLSEEENESALNKEQKIELLNIARTTVETYINEDKKYKPKTSDERLSWKEGAFVTLRINGNLRGCIGQIVPSEKPLYEVVRDMAISACSEDNRFNPVSKDELGNLDYEVSVLSVPENIDNYKNIELGKHGVIIKKGLRSGVFLPQVADETGWSLDEFLSELCYQKAGLPPDCYKDSDTQIFVFTAQVFSEKELD